MLGLRLLTTGLMIYHADNPRWTEVMDGDIRSGALEQELESLVKPDGSASDDHASP